MTNVHTVSNFNDYSLEGINCIEASAGTGKTYTISHLYLRLIIEKELSIDNILVVTFTNAATDELRSRIRTIIKVAYEMVEERCSDEIIKKYSELYEYLNTMCAKDSGNYRLQIKEKLQLALSEIDKAHIYTIHSFCSRTLNEFAFESRTLYGSTLVEDESPYIQRVVEDFYYSTIAPLGQEFVALFFQKNEDFVRWFMKLLRKLPDDPDIAILPDIPFEPGSLQQQVYTLTNQINAIREKFNSEFGSIKDNYCKALADGLLNKKSYNENDIYTLQQTILMLSVYSALQDDINKNLKKFSLSGLLSKLVGAYKKEEKSYTWHEFFALLDECRNTIINIKIQIIAAYREFIRYSETRYLQYRDRWNIISFKDILKDMHKALQQGTDSKLAIRVRERFKAALIDEFQDTDPLQYNIFTTIFKKKGYTLYIIGDPKQAIYSFRGADVFAYIKARAGADNIYTLTKSFRSTKALTNVINFIFSRINNPFVFNEIQYHPVESQMKDSSFDKEALQIWFIRQDDIDNKSISVGVARKIIAKNIVREIQMIVNGLYVIDGKPIQYSDIAILVRKHHEAELVQDVLRQCGINSVLYSRQSVFTTPEVWELLHVLEAIINPSSTGAVKRALVTSLFGYCGNDIIQLEQQGSLDSIKMQCAAYLDVWKLKGFIVMLQRLLNDDAIVKKRNDHDTVAKRLLQYNDGERVITNILHCAEILADTEREKKLDPVALVEWLKKAMYIESEAKEQELRLESDANAVKIVTIHASKGLEYPVVFCPYLFNVSSLDEIFVFHDSADNNYKTHVLFKFARDKAEEKALLFPDNDYDALEFIAKCEQLAESLRIAYVAITRAKFRCYVGWGNINTTKTSALRYLFHHNDSTLEQFINGIDCSTEDLLNDLKLIELQSGGFISVKSIHDEILLAKDSIKPIYHPPKYFKKIIKKIEPGWQLTSYTSLSYKREDAKSDEVQIPVIVKEEIKEQSVFTFPAGSIPGLCIHKIFETIDFDADNKTISQAVSDTLKSYNISSVWADIVTTMVYNVLNAPLMTNFVSLSKISANKRRHELEFYYPVEHLESKRMVQLFNQHNLFTMKYAKALEQLSFADISGFMHGFIDMVFEHNNAYYIVDWKSNLLGASLEDYHRSKLDNAIASHLYFLQYTIYTVAVHRYLQLMLGKAYNYEKHFGGVFYIFVRGVDASRGCEYGIFYDKPDAVLISKLDNLLAGKAI